MTTLLNQIKQNHAKTQNCNEFECPRCSGKGWLPEFRHIKNGTCFLCNGNKTIKVGSQLNLGKGRKPKVVFKKANTEYRVAETIEVWFDGKYGYVQEFVMYINDGNRQELRDLWKCLKDNGAIMQIATVDVQFTEENYRLCIRDVSFDYQTV